MLPDGLRDCPIFTNVEAFYNARPERRFSPEADYGAQWRIGGSQSEPRWRVSYVRDTGEIYACCYGEVNTVIVLGELPTDRELPGPEYYRELDKLLDAYWEHNSLEWVRQMLAGRERDLQDELGMGAS